MGKERMQCEREKEKNYTRERRRERKNKRRPHKADRTVEPTQDLNILGDKIFPHCMDTFPCKTCSFSSVRRMHK